MNLQQNHRYLKTIMNVRVKISACLVNLRLYSNQARSQDLKKGGGYFERVRSVHTTLTRILIDLESVSDGLSEI